MEQETEQQEGGKGGIWYDGRGQNEQLKFIDMQKFTSFWFGFCKWAKLILFLFLFLFEQPAWLSCENFCPFSVCSFCLPYVSATFCSFLLFLSHSLSLSCWLLFWLANNKGKLLLSQKFLTYKFSCFLACCSDCSLSWR